MAEVNAALAALGLDPSPGDDRNDPDPVPVAAPVAPEVVSETPPAPESPPTAPESAIEPEDDEVVVPEGAENPDAVRNAIQAERKRAREANARARELEARLKAEQEAALPLSDQIKLATERAEAAEKRMLAVEVAAEAGIDLKLASRLQGSTREELLADAESLKGMLAPAAPPQAPMGGGMRTPPPTQGDPALEHNQTILGVIQAARQGKGGF